jgi:hypothetical protein
MGPTMPSSSASSSPPAARWLGRCDMLQAQ